MLCVSPKLVTKTNELHSTRAGLRPLKKLCILSQEFFEKIGLAGASETKKMCVMEKT